MAHEVYEILQVKPFNSKYSCSASISVNCDYESGSRIAFNFARCECTKHIKIHQLWILDFIKSYRPNVFTQNLLIQLI